MYVRPQNNPKTNDPKVFKLGIGNNTFRYPTIDMVLGQKVEGQGHRVTKCKNIFKAIEYPSFGFVDFATIHNVKGFLI